MRSVIVSCRHCKGSGKIRHRCNPYNMEVFKLHTASGNTGPLFYRLEKICRCKTCGRLWKIIYIWDENSSPEQIWLEPGQTQKGYSFTTDEAGKFSAPEDAPEAKSVQYHFGFKKLSLDNIIRPDFHLFGGRTPEGNAFSLPVEYWAEQVLKYELNEGVPHEIKAMFEVARGSMVYGYFFYPLCTLAAEQLFRIAEAAAKTKCIKEDSPQGALKWLDRSIDWLIAHGHVKEENRHLWYLIKDLRNKYSHPRQQALKNPLMVFETLEIIVELINDLFGGANDA